MLCVYIIILKENVVLLKFLRIANISMIEQCSEISGGGGLREKGDRCNGKEGGKTDKTCGREEKPMFSRQSYSFIIIVVILTSISFMIENKCSLFGILSSIYSFFSFIVKLLSFFSQSVCSDTFIN